MEASILRLDRQSLPQPHILPPVPQVSLQILRGRVRQRTRQIPGKVFLIGAASDCDLVLGDLTFPEAFAYIFVSGTELSIRRLGSGPALVVCGDEVDSSELFHGDTIVMGPFELRVSVDYPPRRSRTTQPGCAEPTIDADDDYGEESPIDEVRSLLADIRQALAEDSASVRLYHEPEVECDDETEEYDSRHASARRASA